MAEHSDDAPRKLTDAEIDAQMARIDGINGSAGHHLEDPYLRDLLRQQIAGEITGDRARELGHQHLARQHGDPKHDNGATL
ncbi:hypothetical protein [Cryobacterium sp. 5B3]|uniref:hypothetical protein n=1 Tax=Cryobacterium sp. 5B3 TaxID=3048586 RepID=UPI002AB52853|nr:hypothetical protein [Cryobacterium sp. 5B3]MDY7541774.1 hypothetical protein [Cryobacterium sp. 5B3]MEB0275246.1 hypothetical protein [Cryobacterium sp. 5B3]